MHHAMLRGAALCAVWVGLWAGGPARAAEDAARAPGETGLVGVVNVNTASAEELELLPGVGPARARAIIAHRTERGEFKKAEDLIGVGGIGERAFERIRPHVAVSGKTNVRQEP
jgi:competence protein ComEA